MANRRPEGDPPLCACGCGEPVRGWKYGIWSQWLPGHSSRRHSTPHPKPDYRSSPNQQLRLWRGRP